MNPFIMMFGPMGMSFSGGCNCGVFMPYYGQNDMLSFMNFPIFRNTGSDYLLDPRLAIQQTQFSMQNGSLFGSSYLPMFNNFPGVSPFNPVWQTNSQQKTETDEEKKKRETKEAEAKKPEAEKAAALKKSFDKIKKLAETHKGFVNLDDSIVKKAEEALKKETAAEQLKAMKEVMELIPDDIIRKSIIADDKVVEKLKEAGYNFNYKNNKYSLPASSISENLNEVHDNIISKRDYTALGLLAANLTSGKTPILAAISSWNNTQNEKGILKFIAANLPAEAPLAQVKLIVPQIINALIDKADEYSGCSKIKADRDNLAKLKDDLLQNFDSTNLNKVSDAFEKLYARLRMQETAQVRDYIKGNNDFKIYNEINDDIINDEMLVAETYANLKEEGITSVPKADELDAIAAPTTVTVREDGVVDKAKEYENNTQALVDDYLAKDNKYLTQVNEKLNIYKTDDCDGNGLGAKYYTVKDNKIIEVKKKGDETYDIPADAVEVKAEDIEVYDETIKRIKFLIADKSIEPYKGQFITATLPYPVFKATGANEFYALIDEEFGKIKKCTNIAEDKANKKISAVGTGKTLDRITADDLDTEFSDNEVKSEKWKKEEEQKKADKMSSERAAKISKDAYTLKALDSQIGQLGLEKTGVTGYYKTKKTPVLYFRYDDNENSPTYQHLVHLNNVEGITSDGSMKIKGSNAVKSCKEVQKSSECAKDLYTVLNETAYKSDSYKKMKSAEQIAKDIATIKRKMNSFKSYTSVNDVITFIKTYQNEAYHWWRRNDSSLCLAIASHKALSENEKKEFIKLIAIKVLQITNKKGLSFEDKATLENISKGRLVSYNGMQTGITVGTTACELDRIIAIFMEKYDELMTSQLN